MTILLKEELILFRLETCQRRCDSHSAGCRVSTGRNVSYWN